MENNLENARTYLLGRITTESDQEDVARVLFQYASLVQPAIVLPEHKKPAPDDYADFAVCAGWNRCLSEIKRLNPSKNSEG